MTLGTKKTGQGQYEITFDGLTIGTAKKHDGRYHIEYKDGVHATARNTGAVLDRAADWILDRLGAC